MIEPAPAEEIAASEEPDWIRSGLALARLEVFAYLRTLRDVSFSPARFAADFAAGGRTMHPIGFLATSIALMGAVSTASGALLGAEGGIAFDLARSITPYLHYAAIGLMVHAGLRLAGSTRRAQTTVAAVLFVAAGPTALLDMAHLVLSVAVRLHLGMTHGENLYPVLQSAHPALFASVEIMDWLQLVVFYGVTTAALFGLQRDRPTRLAIPVALALSELCMGILAGQLYLRLGISPAFLGTLHPQWVFVWTHAGPQAMRFN